MYSNIFTKGIPKLKAFFTDIDAMRKITILLLPIALMAVSPFETPEPTNFNLSVFDTKKSEANKKAANNQKVKCRYVCDKKVYTEQKIAEAISFYKKTKTTK